MAGLDLSTKDDLRGGVKSCVAGLKSTFNFLHLIDCVLGWFRSCLTTTRVAADFQTYSVFLRGGVGFHSKNRLFSLVTSNNTLKS